MQQFNIKVLVISISRPLLIGIYQENILLETFSNEGKTSDILPSLFETILSKYTVNDIVYVNGPGSYMAIKIAYVFLKTISIVHKINLYAISGFELNNNSPIKALGKKYFFRDKNDKEKINIDFIGENRIDEFILPECLEMLKFNTNTLPEYNLPAV